MLAARHFFQPIATCRRATAVWRGPAVDLPADCQIVDPFAQEASSPFAVVASAWDDDALYFAVQANLRREPRVKPSRFWDADCVELFLDLRGSLRRDTYTEHCFHFYAMPGGAGSRTPRAGLCEPGVATQVAIADYAAVQTASESFAQGYRLRITLTRGAIPSFDPVGFPSIGFNYIIHDASGRDQAWSAGRDLATFRDPSTWGILECIA